MPLTMKKIVRLNAFAIIALLTSALITSPSCKKEEEQKRNIMTFDGKEYTLAHGAIVHYGRVNDDPLTYSLDLTLLSPGFKLHSSGLSIDSLSGAGTGIYLELFSEDSLLLLTGDYNYSNEYAPQPFKLNYGDFVIDYTMEDETGEIYEITEGTVTIKLSYDIYEVTINCKDENGKEVTGFYSGMLRLYYDFNKGAEPAWKSLQ
jgi:hypothetical protein